MSGFFVVFEGGDGAGKTTQVEACREALVAEGESVVCTREPGGTSLGHQIREVVLSPQDGVVEPRCEALLVAADKAQHVSELIGPALAAGQIVLCDRYVDSMLAYQGAGRVLEIEELARIAQWAVGGLIPDLTVLLDVDPREGVHAKEDLDRMEGAGQEFHQRVRQGFLQLAQQAPARYVVIPARLPREQITAQIMTELLQRRANCRLAARD